VQCSALSFVGKVLGADVICGFVAVAACSQKVEWCWDSQVFWKHLQVLGVTCPPCVHHRQGMPEWDV
jgi:hypothetical protein